MIRKTRGLVIGEQSVKESDRYITILTATEGLVKATAYGARKTSSPIAAQTRLFACADFNLSQSRGYYKVDSADTVETFFELSGSMENVAAASYFCELLSDVALAGIADEETLRLALYALYALAKQNRPHALVKAVFELRLMAISGYEPLLSDCGDCGKPIEGDCFFSQRDGCVVCGSCARKLYGNVKLNPPALAAMRYTVTAPVEKLFRFSLTGDSFPLFAAACEAYALAQMDRSYKALGVYKSIAAFSALVPTDQTT